jgi:hypothetical protein
MLISWPPMLAADADQLAELAELAADAGRRCWPPMLISSAADADQLAELAADAGRRC